MTGGRFDGKRQDQSWWTSMGPGFALAHFFLGDPVMGPFAQVGRADVLPPGPVHYHRTDSFRVVLDGTTVVGRTAYGAGDFRLQPAGQYYGPEAGDQPHTLLTLFADRRGFEVFPAKAEHRRETAKAMEMVRAMYGDHVPEVLERESSGHTALSASSPLQERASHADGSFAKTDGWTELAEGISGLALGLGDRDGPVVLLARAASGALLPKTALDDRMRVVLAGTIRESDRTFDPGSFSLLEASAGLVPAQAGPEGADVVEICADRTTLLADSPWRGLTDNLKALS